MNATVTAAAGGPIDLAQPIELARPIGFDGGDARHFDAPAPQSAPLTAGDFTGAVALGASCNCRTITLTPHCHGTHTECVSHLTAEPLDAWRVVPVAPVAAWVVTVTPAPLGTDRVVTRAVLDAAWPATAAPVSPLALIVRTACGDTDQDDGAVPPYFAADAAEALVARGIAHLVLDLPSLDRVQDEGRLAAHRVFFGLPPASRRLADATRPHATITELARIPAALSDGPCALAWQVPAIAGDAVPSRPLAYRYRA